MGRSQITDLLFSLESPRDTGLLNLPYRKIYPTATCSTLVQSLVDQCRGGGLKGQGVFWVDFGCDQHFGVALYL